MGGVKILRIPSSILKSDEEPPLDWGGGTERLRRRVMAAYAATPSHEKTYPEAQPTGTSLFERRNDDDEGYVRWYPWLIMCHRTPCARMVQHF